MDGEVAEELHSVGAPGWHTSWVAAKVRRVHEQDPPDLLDDLRLRLHHMASVRWRRLDGAHLLPLVRAGVSFVDGLHQAGAKTKTRRKAA